MWSESYIFSSFFFQWIFFPQNNSSSSTCLFLLVEISEFAWRWTKKKIGENRRKVLFLHITAYWRWHYYVNRINLNGMHSGWNFNRQIEWIRQLSAPSLCVFLFSSFRSFIHPFIHWRVSQWLVSLLTLIIKLRMEKVCNSWLPFHRYKNNLTDIYWLPSRLHSIKLGIKMNTESRQSVRETERECVSKWCDNLAPKNHSIRYGKWL